MKKHTKPSTYLVLFGVIALAYYTALIISLMVLLKNANIEWETILASGRIIMLTVPVFSLAIGVAGGFFLKRAFVAPVINAAGILAALLILAGQQIFSQIETTIQGILVFAGAFALAVLGEMVVLAVKKIKNGEKVWKIKNRTLWFLIAAFLFFGFLTLSFYYMASNDERGWNPLEVTTIYVALIIPFYAIVSGIFSGALLEKYFLMPLANAVGTAIFLFAIRVDKLAMLAGGAAIAFLVTFAFDRLTALIRRKRERHAPPEAIEKK